MLDITQELADDPRRLHKVSVDLNVCMGCQSCARVCCYGVWEWDDQTRTPTPAYSEECVACLQCMYFCPSGAIDIKQASISFFDLLYDPLGANDEKEAE